MIDIGKNTWTVRSLRRFVYWSCRTFFHIEQTGIEHIPTQGPVIVAANHQTYIDPFFVALPIYFKTHYMTWHKAFSIPLLAPLIRRLGAFPVNIDRSDTQAIRRSLEILQAGEFLIVFPEGGRSPDGTVQPFKPGMARLALAAGAPILPVSLHGGEKVWPPKQWFPRAGKIRVRYHPVITVARAWGLDKSEERARRMALTQQVYETIVRGMQE